MIVLFSHNDQRYVWRGRGEPKNTVPFNPKKTVPAVKLGSGNIMPWGCFAPGGTDAQNSVNNVQRGSTRNSST